MSFKRYALTFVFAAAVGAGGTALVADRYVEHKMATGQPCDVYKGVTQWMNHYDGKAQDPNGKSVAGVNYTEHKIGDVTACAAVAGEGQGKSNVDFVQKIKGLFQ